MLTKTLICIPTYNESENILEILQRLLSTCSELVDRFEITILIIDDNSPDGTAQLVQRENLEKVQILHRESKSGLGPAYIAGFDWGLHRNFDLFVEMDADGSHQPEQLPSLLDASTGCDLVIGTRWMPRGQVINWPLHRRLISRLGTKYAQIALRLPYSDLTGGFRVLSRHCLEAIDFTTIETLGYGFQIEIAMRTHDSNLAIAQVPITFIERTNGESKMSKKIVWEALAKTTKWSFQRYSKAR